jgi:fructokinase
LTALLAGVETGGTRCNLAVGTGPGDLRATESIPTTGPDETIGRIAAFLAEHAPVDALGIGAFGPVDVDPGSKTWGRVGNTPKPGWSGADLAGRLAGELGGVPVGFDTDVNAAALGERRWGAGDGLDDLVYITVGTGIGGGAVAGGRAVHGLGHPEMGHVPVPRDPERDPFRGSCPYHGDCLEGLASGTAMRARWGVGGEELPPEHQAWRLEAGYLAHGIAAIAYVLSPRRVILGGGVMHAPGLLELVRGELERLLSGYVDAPELVRPGLGDRAGVLGALALAEEALALSP